MALPRISYVNGRYARHTNATVHIEDRGYQFADGVYEVMQYINNRIIDGIPHFKRLGESLAQLSIRMPVSINAMQLIIHELARRNRVSEGTIYLQITRGVAPRNHTFPKIAVRPSLVIVLTGLKVPPGIEYENGISVISRPDIRWTKCDIKSISLLGNILGKQEAAENGVKEIWFTRDGYVTEGGSSNAMIVDANGVIRTHPKGKLILAGITRDVLLNLAQKHNIKISEEPFTLKEVDTAKEAFITSTTAGALPVVKVDGKIVADGRPGKVTKILIQAYQGHLQKEAGLVA